MKKLTLVLLVALPLSSVANAQSDNCFGSDTLYSCYDYKTGNNYNVSKLGSTTFVNGHNSSTGSNWSQNSNTIGNTTYQNGISSNLIYHLID